MRRGTYCAIAVATLLASGCSEKPSRATRTEDPRQPRRLTELSDFGAEVFPLANGGAYLVSPKDNQIFLLSRAAAHRIEGVKLGGFDTTVYPLPDGAAYLVTSNERHLRLYYLLSDKAVLVQEAPVERSALDRAAAPAEAFLWAQMQATLIRYRRVRAAEAFEPDDIPPY